MIERLSADTPLDLARLGGKGRGLVRLLQAGFRVPDAWCLPADREPDPERLDAALAKLVAEHPETSFAVRSSATAEDLHDASFAGVYTTILGACGQAELKSAVEACSASLDTPSARAYRDARGIGHDVRMAVLIQRLIEPEIAGVLLTANPQRAFADEIVIDAAYGMGEGVVSGRADPDHVVLERSTGALREQRIGEKKIALRHRGGSVLTEETVPAESRGRLCLDESAIRSLHALAERVGETLGPRMDLEWAFEAGELHLLQARAITGLPPEDPSEVWSRKFGDEYMADYTTPSGYTFLVRWIREYTFTETARRLGRRDLLEIEPLRRHRGYVYMSGRYSASSARGLPAGSRAGALRGWFTPLWMRRVEAEPFSPLLLLKSLLMPFRDPRGPMKKNVAALEVHARRVVRELGGWSPADYQALSDGELLAAIEAVDEIGYDHFRVIRWGMGQYAPMLHGALQGLLAGWAGDASGELYQLLVSGLPGTHTAEINRDIWQLGALARDEPALGSGLLSGQSADDLRRDTAGSAFWPAFDTFLVRHGHRSTTRDIAQPRWRESPALILSLVRAQLAGEAPPENPERLEARSLERRREAEARALASLGGGPVAWLRRRILRWVCDRAQLFTVYRENQRYYLDVVLWHLRQLVLELGRRLSARGPLSEPWEAFLLEADELRALARDPRPSASLRDELAARRAHYERWRDRLPATYLFDEVETEGEVVEGDPAPGPTGADGQAEPAGLGAARGRARGRLRVLKLASGLDQLEPGEILVAPNIDPGWTSVFPMLSGLVSETGGLLSHGALLAREYGIPAVMGVRGATTRFETGDWVVLDGTLGTIEAIEAPSGAGPSGLIERDRSI